MDVALELLSGIAWSYAYWRIFRVSLPAKSYGMPILAAALNLSWEAVYFSGGIIYWGKYDSSTQIQTAINGVWLILDACIAIIIVRYGAE